MDLQEKNDADFAKEIASLGDFYVNDAFGTAHRWEHAMIQGLQPAELTTTARQGACIYSWCRSIHPWRVCLRIPAGEGAEGDPQFVFRLCAPLLPC